MAESQIFDEIVTPASLWLGWRLGIGIIVLWCVEVLGLAIAYAFNVLGVFR